MSKELRTHPVLHDAASITGSEPYLCSILGSSCGVEWVTSAGRSSETDSAFTCTNFTLPGFHGGLANSKHTTETRAGLADPVAEAGGRAEP